MQRQGQLHTPELLILHERTGEPLATWTYASQELLELEYQEFFLKSWQMVGHVCDLPNPGDFLTFDLWRDSVMDQQSIHRIANRGTLYFGIDYDRRNLGQVCGGVNIYMADTNATGDDRDRGIVDRELVQCRPTAGNNHVNQAIGPQHPLYQLPVWRFYQLGAGGREPSNGATQLHGFCQGLI